MAKKTKKAAAGNNGSDETPQGAAMAQAAPEGAQFGILVQFVKDISFESPNAPMTLQAPGENPKLGVNVQVSALKRSTDLYEVNIMFEAKAESDAGVIYNVELVYATLFQAMNIPDEYLKPVLFVDAPTIMFPYLRRVVSDLTRDGGFQPLLVDPIDFAGLFQHNQDKAVIQDLSSEAQSA